MILDRKVDRSRALIMKEKLTYFIYYFRPHFDRKKFFALLLAVIAASTLVNYLFFGRTDWASHVLLLVLLVSLAYGMILLLALYDGWVLKKGSVGLYFFLFEQ